MPDRSATQNPPRLVHAELALLLPTDDFRLLETLAAVFDFGVRGFAQPFVVRLAGRAGGVVVGLIGAGQLGRAAGFARALAAEARVFLEAAAVGVAGILLTAILFVSPPGFFGVFAGLVGLLAIFSLIVSGRVLGFERAPLVLLRQEITAGIRLESCPCPSFAGLRPGAG